MSLPIPTYFPGDTRLHALVSYEYVSDEELERVLQVSASHGQNALAATIDARNEAGQSPLHLAAQCAYFYGVEALLRYGADPVATDVRGRQPVHVAALLPQHAEELLDLLSFQGCDMSASDGEGLTPLHLSAAVGNAGCVRALMLSGAADSNARTREGETPLLLAIEHQQLESVRELLANGASTEARSLDGQTPRMLAERIASSKTGSEAIKAHARTIAELVRSYSSIKMIRGNPSQPLPQGLSMMMTRPQNRGEGGGGGGGLGLGGGGGSPLNYTHDPPQHQWRGGGGGGVIQSSRHHKPPYLPPTSDPSYQTYPQTHSRFSTPLPPPLPHASNSSAYVNPPYNASGQSTLYDHTQTRYGMIANPPSTLNAQRSLIQHQQSRFTSSPTLSSSQPHYHHHNHQTTQHYDQRLVPYSDRLGEPTSFAFPPPPPPPPPVPPPPPPLRIVKPDSSPQMQSRSTPQNSSSPSMIQASGTSDEYDSPSSRGTPKPQYLQTPAKIGRLDSDGRNSRNSLRNNTNSITPYGNNDSESDRGGGGGSNSAYRSDYASGGESSGFESPAGPISSSRRQQQHQQQGGGGAFTPDHSLSSSRHDASPAAVTEYEKHERNTLIPRNIFSNSPGESNHSDYSRNNSPGGIGGNMNNNRSSNHHHNLYQNQEVGGQQAAAQDAARKSAATPLPRPASRSSSRSRTGAANDGGERGGGIIVTSRPAESVDSSSAYSTSVPSISSTNRASPSLAYQSPTPLSATAATAGASSSQVVTSISSLLPSSKSIVKPTEDKEEEEDDDDKKVLPFQSLIPSSTIPSMSTGSDSMIASTSPPSIPLIFTNVDTVSSSTSSSSSSSANAAASNDDNNNKDDDDVQDDSSFIVPGIQHHQYHHKMLHHHHHQQKQSLPHPHRSSSPVGISGDSASPKITPRPTPLSLSPRTPSSSNSHAPPGGLFSTISSSISSYSSSDDVLLARASNHQQSQHHHQPHTISKSSIAISSSSSSSQSAAAWGSSLDGKKRSTSPTILTINTNPENDESDVINGDDINAGAADAAASADVIRDGDDSRYINYGSARDLNKTSSSDVLSHHEQLGHDINRTSGSKSHQHRNRMSAVSAGVGPGTPAGAVDTTFHSSSSLSSLSSSNNNNRKRDTTTSMPPILGTPSSTSSGIAEAAMAAASEYQVKVAELMGELDSAKKREIHLLKELEKTRSEAEAGREELVKEIQALRALVLSDRK